MNLTISPQIRIVAVIGLVAMVALGGSVMMLGRSHKVAVPATGERHGSAAPRKTTTPANAKAHVIPPTAHAKPKVAVKAVGISATPL